MAATVTSGDITLFGAEMSERTAPDHHVKKANPNRFDGSERLSLCRSFTK
jgi:hypothetical protein